MEKQSLTDQKIIHLDPPLPCGTYRRTDRDGHTVTCGNPAHVAHARPADLDAPNLPELPAGLARPGEWIIMPMCGQCVQKMVKVYTREAPDDKPNR